MLNWEELTANAPKYRGITGQSKTVYFGADEQAPYGRYWDGQALSENPDADEISKYFEFWIALSSMEQREVLQAMYDAQIGLNFEKAFKGKDAYTIVNGAIEWWNKHYGWEVKEFLQYLAWQKDSLRDPKGYDKTKAWKFKGSVPFRVKQFVTLANPELTKYLGQSETKFDKLFYAIFTKAQIGGN